ncbi:S-adenosyl-L-methionine-dependent methyltransferase [Trametes versicolor FP-101664 SS1]|uniref:S-adenosyl-L-methionine-dependent methyltransferase n=1 Tax=Trametes versicolor (strain FP-101664) TaxID=717944 RepID=UPI0004622AF9|nr:S-adenosyl-L-methionine-dependent methyltransferase [Trametes versicolor FP-101664 SS1]EIW56069.1 S-adenosyl-L-methionine-dependent methyltransferase [Trametes versicolor FP-101664 SS1]
MTFAALRSLYALIGDALDDIERVYQDASFDAPPATPATPYDVLASPTTPYRRHRTRSSLEEDETGPIHFPVGRPPKTPRRGHRGAGSSTDFQLLDFPALDNPYYPTEGHAQEEDAAESLASHPDVIAATNRIVAACGQIGATVHRPFLTLCDAAMGYHLPACLRFLEASHTVEILRTAGPDGMHVRDLGRQLGVEEGKLSHILRLLATHHITREVRPNVFANNRISAIMDSGRSPEDLRRAPHEKYETTNGIAAFMNLCTDELFKSSAYLADCYLPSSSRKSGEDENPMHAPFNLAFNTTIPYFEWLEQPGNESRLRRFGPAMTGTAAWEVPGAIIAGFPWQDLDEGALVVDVGGGIGSTSMLLAHTFPHLRFVVQDRPQVADHGVTAWRERCPEMLDTGRAMFLAHDFFQPQPPLLLPGSTNAVVPSVYVLRVITHDWPDTFVTKILLNLRLAAGPDTKLLLADHILPLACVDEDSEDEFGRDHLPGALPSLAPEGSLLLPNLGKANANAYWLDLTMRATFNAQERTLREMAALTLTAGWKIIDVVHAEGSLFGHMTAIPVEIPEASLALLEPPVIAPEVPSASGGTRTRSGSVASASDTVRRGETFGTLSHLPTEEAIRKPTRRDRKPLISWWRGRKDSQTSKTGKPTTPESPAYGLRAQKGRPKLAIVTSSPGPPTYLRSALRSPPVRTASMVRLSAHDSDRTAFSSPETTPDHTKIAHETVVLQGALLPEPDSSPMLLPALEPAPPRLRTMSSRTSLRKKASQVFEFSKASVASLRSAALGGGSSPHAVPPVPPLPPMPPVLPIPHAKSYGGLTPEMARRPGEDARDDGGSAAVTSLRKMRSRSQLGLARVHVEVHSGRARDAGRVERIERDSDE